MITKRENNDKREDYDNRKEKNEWRIEERESKL
jgi:hypothetical protein